MKIINIFSKKGTGFNTDNRPLLQQLVDILKSGSVDKAIALLASKGKSNNPIAIAYTPDAIRTDFSAVSKCMTAEQLTEDELAALIATSMLKKHPKSISQLLLDSGYSNSPEERILYLNTYVSTLRTLEEFTRAGIKKYSISSCGDSRVCSKCAKHEGKKHSVDKAVVGKNAPPFCKSCRCIITAEF